MITEKPQYSPAIQFVLFCAVAFGMIAACNALALLLVFIFHGLKALQLIMAMNLSNPQAIGALWLLQVVGTTVPILLTPIVFGWLVMREPEAYLRTGNRFNFLLLPLVLVIMVASLPVMEVITGLNQQMQLPNFLKGVEEWMRASEESAQKATQALLAMNNWLDLVKCILLVGLVTAIAEELMFRGSLQTILLRWTGNPHTAIWVTAILFSAFHMQFFGFLPRLMLGVFFGYFAYWSGSIWPAVWSHFLNNGWAVVVTYMYQHKLADIDPNAPQTFNYSFYVLSIIFTVALFWTYRNTALQGNNLRHY
jgi:uncharacterized protein